MLRRRSALLAVAIGLVLIAGCTTRVSGPASSAAGSPPAGDSAAADETALPPGATPGLDDINGDGQPDPTCTNKDFGGGLVVRIPCDYATYASAPAPETTLVENSLFGLPSLEIDLSGISGDAVQGRTDSGQKLVVIFINSDTLFAVGSSQLSEPAVANFDAIAKLVQSRWPAAPIQVRGHTDTTGSPSANQRLSEQRASTVSGYLAGHGIDRGRLTPVGLGQTQPIVLEDNPTGQQYNRRVELAIRVG